MYLNTIFLQYVREHVVSLLHTLNALASLHSWHWPNPDVHLPAPASHAK